MRTIRQVAIADGRRITLEQSVTSMQGVPLRWLVHEAGPDSRTIGAVVRAGAELPWRADAGPLQCAHLSFGHTAITTAVRDVVDAAAR
ncbi:hypothetical protein [Egicoccus halophilus]|uniref:Uncharacterized protein n=1 Tax=Egicoccus halophilus TaxID=1670830 RepID=A0A8J3A7I5_9ACTN|nr:hypothetical protein [Egicoccus halophilus]GGI05480.1 hypothetical protein GCM10011354_14310 [Egicoccus halophilus]